ncbi:MAG TPA: BamA/TamA family outer membrane protein [Kofleriaceae bacterium]|nr:BamA/TamA family outer membrane protein [Kofleriaceae bacterium]
MLAPRRQLARIAPASIAAIVAIAPAAAAEPEPSSSVVGVVQPRPTGEPPVSTPVAAPASGRELTAADVAAAPLPGFESGRIDQSEGDSAWRQIGRGALFVPKLVIDAALTPLRGVVWVNDHWKPLDWYDRVFFTDDKTIGLYPTGSIDTTLGVTIGAHFVHKDLLGEHEQLDLQAEASSQYRQIYAATIGSGKRLGDRLAVTLDVAYERRPHDAFYGIGNGDRVDTAPAPIDPRVDPTSIESHYRQDRARTTAIADLHAWSQLHVRASGALSEVQFGAPDEGEQIAAIYDTRGLVGFGGIQYGYGELELRWDNRHSTTIFEPSAVYSAGELAAVFAGQMHRLDDGPDFWRYGVDLQKFIRLGRGPRVIAAHFHGEGVTGSRDEVPFTELPKLGGPNWLRGYALDQFRDRIAAFGSVAYGWDLSQWVQASLFVDVGRVYPELGELSLDHMRLGYGVALEGHRVESFLVQASLGSSIDGGLFLNLSFNPVYDLEQRVRRR